MRIPGQCIGEGEIMNNNIVAAPRLWRCGVVGMATMQCTMRNIITVLACCLLCWRLSHPRSLIMAVALQV